MPLPSEKLSAHFHLRIPADLFYWCDNAVEAEGNLFDQRVNIDSLLNPGSSTVWGGQMLPDSLPLIGNGAGDQICARFNPDGTLRELIRWCHEGGGWLPCGMQLATAITYADAVDGDAYLVPAGLGRVQELHLTVRQCLDSGLHKACRSAGGLNIAKAAGVPWPQFQAQKFDASLLTLEVQQKIGKALSQSPRDLFTQDWESAAEFAAEVIQLRLDVSWPFAVRGWALERQGRLHEAIEIYDRGAAALNTTADFTDLWNSPSHARKFVLQALCRLMPCEISAQSMAMIEASKTRSGIRAYWLNLANEAEGGRCFLKAYECVFRAGWDDFYTNDMPELLERMARLAKSAGAKPLAALAEHHQRAAMP